MSMEEELGLIGVKSKTLLIDGDIIIYQPCCIFNSDSDQDRRMIAKQISNKVDKLIEAAGCDRYMMFVTTRDNFRDHLVDDYKANRKEEDRPVNLAWAKRWAVKNLSNFFVKGLEADDLLGIHNKEDCIIWSTDKDLRQLPGYHLDDETKKVIYVSKEGRLEEKKWVTESGNHRSKVYFEGDVGLYYQMLIGDSTDNIIGCAERKMVAPKSGPNKGIPALKRVGVGPQQAFKGIMQAIIYKGSRTITEAVHQFVIAQYKKVWGDDWQKHLETQANLLFMVRMQQGKYFRRWTFDGRKEYFNLKTNKVLSLEEFNDERNRS